MSNNVKYINVDGRSYCIVDKGRSFGHSLAFDTCKQLNARLPLPRNQLELDEFRKISGKFWTHVDARNPKKTSDKALWIDAEGKPLGNRPVYLRVTNRQTTDVSITEVCVLFLTHFKSGKWLTQTQMIQ